MQKHFRFIQAAFFPAISELDIFYLRRHLVQIGVVGQLNIRAKLIAIPVIFVFRGQFNYVPGSDSDRKIDDGSFRPNRVPLRIFRLNMSAMSGST